MNLTATTKSASRPFARLCMTVGQMLALFYICAAYDVPFYLKYAKEMEHVTFAQYALTLQKAGINVGDEDGEHFNDGDTDVETVLDYIATDEERWRRVWGSEYSTDDCRRLDDIFDTYAARLVSAGGYDAQQEDTLRVCAKMRLKADYALTQGGKADIDIAAKLNKMIQDNLASENLRKRDEKPVEELRIDSIVDALEKAGFLKKGKILPLADVQRVLVERAGIMGGKPSHVYPYTLDAADQMIQAIINTMRTNDGLPVITRLPDNMRLDANVANEFAKEPNTEEEEAYSKMGLVRQNPKDMGEIIPQSVQTKRTAQQKPQNSGKPYARPNTPPKKP